MLEIIQNHWQWSPHGADTEPLSVSTQPLVLVPHATETHIKFEPRFDRVFVGKNLEHITFHVGRHAHTVAVSSAMRAPDTWPILDTPQPETSIEKWPSTMHDQSTIDGSECVSIEVKASHPLFQSAEGGFTNSILWDFPTFVIKRELYGINPSSPVMATVWYSVHDANGEQVPWILRWRAEVDRETYARFPLQHIVQTEHTFTHSESTFRGVLLPQQVEITDLRWEYTSLPVRIGLQTEPPALKVQYEDESDQVYIPIDTEKEDRALNDLVRTLNVVGRCGLVQRTTMILGKQKVTYSIDEQGNFGLDVSAHFVRLLGIERTTKYLEFDIDNESQKPTMRLPDVEYLKDYDDDESLKNALSNLINSELESSLNKTFLFQECDNRHWSVECWYGFRKVSLRFSVFLGKILLNEVFIFPKLKSKDLKAIISTKGSPRRVIIGVNEPPFLRIWFLYKEIYPGPTEIPAPELLRAVELPLDLMTNTIGGIAFHISASDSTGLTFKLHTPGYTSQVSSQFEKSRRKDQRHEKDGKPPREAKKRGRQHRGRGKPEEPKNQQNEYGLAELARKSAKAREDLARNNDLGTRPSEPRRAEDQDERSP